MKINEEHRKEFFSKPITLIFNEEICENVGSLEEKLKSAGFRDIELIHCTSSKGDPAVTIYYSGNFIYGKRIDEFLNYARWYANVA